MRDLGYKKVHKQFIKQMFAEANRNGNSHTISYEDFVDFLESKSSLASQNQSNAAENTATLSLPKLDADIEILFNYCSSFYFLII